MRCNWIAVPVEVHFLQLCHSDYQTSSAATCSPDGRISQELQHSGGLLLINDCLHVSWVIHSVPPRHLVQQLMLLNLKGNAKL